MRQKDFRSFLAHWLFTPLAGVTLTNWAGFLKKWGLQISPRYWPRTLFTTGMACLNSLVTLFENRRYSASIRDMKVERPIFIIGHHRSGTTHLWNLLSRDPRFVYPNVLQAVFPHTFLTFEPFIQGLAKIFAPQKRPQDNVPFDPESPIEEERAICTNTFLSIQMARHLPQMRDRFKNYLTMRSVSQENVERWKEALDRFARKLLVRHGRDITLLFKAPDHTAKIRLLLELYPDARFIHIHRDPYRVFQSTMKMEKTTLPLYAYQKISFGNLEDFVIWRYKAMYNALLEDIPQIPDGQYAEVSYDELDREPLRTVEQIYNSLNLSGFEEVKKDMEDYIHSISGYKKNRYPELPQRLKQRIFKEWHHIFEEYNYTV